MLKRTKVSGSRKIKVTFVLPVDEPAGPVSVVGDFNEWRPGVHLLRKRSNGTRSASVTLPPGTKVRFRYLGPEGQWFDEEHVDDRDGQNGVIVI